MMTPLITMHPIWQSGAVILAAVVIIALLLQLLMHHLLPVALRQEHTVLGAAIFTVIGTTYAVLLAFMATTAWDQYSAAQEVARHEADLIGSVFQASYGAPEPAGATMRADLRDYLGRIISVEWPAQVAGRTVPAAEGLLMRLDHTVLDLKPVDAGAANVQSFLLKTLSDVATARRDRRLATHGTIPDLVWMVLLSGGALMVGFSFLLGGPRLIVHMIMTAALVASGVLVLLLIVGLSSPFHGAVTISPDPYLEILAEVEARS